MSKQQTTGTSAIERLSQRIAREKSAGLIGLSFYPGSDREISHEDAACVALAMLDYADSVTPHF